MVLGTNRWLGVRGDVICSMFIAGVALVTVLLSQSPGMNISKNKQTNKQKADKETLRMYTATHRNKMHTAVTNMTK